ncbi:7609_t:CDS:2 [Ambispora leptoticha]|uniref:7609_t:CDS:1 n=1 Tax=Ambispora leptoticha TaxID=144679 RepID=A0A9N8WIP0_9GLOM|nr:7609_t:CDS:2 [Ambispora leptoticha]
MFSCQHCKQPIKIDESLVDLNNTSIDLLLAPPPEDDLRSTTSVLNSSGKSLNNNLQQISHAFESTTNNSLAKRSNATTHNYGLSRSPTINNKESFLGPSESYVMLSRSQVAPPLNSSNELPMDANADDRQRASLSYRLKLARRLFDLMSSRSEIDHPICQECTDMLLESLNKQLSDASKERDCYIDFLKKVNSNVISDAKQEDLRQEIQEIQARESRAITTLKEIERERDNMKRELAELEQEANELDKLEESYWKEFNDFHIQLQIFQNERDSVNVKYDHDAKQLEKLQKTNVYNDTFCISHDGSFGTINGFRLGRLQNQPVEWSEINAAWGQAVLLLATIANKLNFTFKTYRLVPLGSFSRIEKIGDDEQSYELYGSGDIGIGRIFQNNRFDNAMVAFLNCLQQLGDYAERQDHNLKLPYRINKDRIGDVSIKRQFNQDDNWTRALKYTLTNTKWILAYASSSNHDWSKQRSNFLSTR